jgi:hypothetical protein
MKQSRNCAIDIIIMKYEICYNDIKITRFLYYMTSLYDKFTSNQNKGMIWNLLCADAIFKTIPDEKANLVKEDFDRKIEKIARQITPTDNLVNLCKRLISEMMNDVEKYKKRERSINKPKDDKMTLNYSAAEIAQTRQKMFENELQNKQKEFDRLNTIQTPEKIDFSDNLDSPIGSEIDKILAEQIALREKQLNMVLQTQDKETATKWIQNPNDIKEPIKLKIGENIVPKKKVVFADTLDNDFMSALKKKDVSPPEDITALLREILNKQNQILELLIPLDISQRNKLNADL